MDPTQPRPIEYAEESVEGTNSAFLGIDCERFEEIEENFEEMKTGNFPVALPVRDVEEGIRLTEKFERLG